MLLGNKQALLSDKYRHNACMLNVMHYLHVCSEYKPMCEKLRQVRKEAGQNSTPPGGDGLDGATGIWGVFILIIKMIYLDGVR